MLFKGCMRIKKIVQFPLMCQGQTLLQVFLKKMRFQHLYWRAKSALTEVTYKDIETIAFCKIFW